MDIMFFMLLLQLMSCILLIAILLNITKEDKKTVSEGDTIMILDRKMLSKVIKVDDENVFFKDNGSVSFAPHNKVMKVSS